MALLIPSTMAHEGLCTQKEVPPELEDLATTLAIQENPSNMGQYDASMAVATRRIWAPGRKLRVKILNGHERARDRIQHYANVWTKYANIKFEFVEWGEAEIRVNIDGSRQTWSHVGTNNLVVPVNEPTMNFGWLSENTPESEYSKVILHEFGHALGCIHEHQSPTNGIPWNRSAVYTYYERVGLSPAEVEKNILRKYDQNITQYTKFDKYSIMLYPIPRRLTLDGFGTRTNTRLSNTDKLFISLVYPIDEVKPFPDGRHVSR
jgi:hypothetical protein